MDLQQLSAPFPREAIHWRAQSVTKDGTKALALAYLDARDVMDRLDEVCGPENWQSEVTETAKGRVICRLGIRTENGWVWKSDGAGDTAVEGEKGGISDALKRAAVSWGVGRYLYRLKSPWVPCKCSEWNGKKQWKEWTADPWQFVRGGTPAPKPADNGPSEADWFTATLPNVKDADGINALLPRAKKAGRDVQKLLVDRAKALQLEFDADARRYVYLEEANPQEKDAA